MNVRQAIRRYGVLGTLARGPKKVSKVARRAIYRTFGVEACRTEYGVLMHANWGDATFEMCLNGSYGHTLANLLRERQSPFVFFDIGANQGLYSLIAGSNRNCKHVYAFEPVASTFGLLEKNVALNDLGARVTPIKAAISDSDGVVGIAVSAGHSGVASLHHNLSNGTEEVMTRTMETVVGEIGLPGFPIFAKVDVEGHELTVLRQLAKSLSGVLDTIFYEVDEQWSDPRDLEAALAGLGFTFQKVGVGTHYDVLATRN